jgi:hypothetical protein
MRPLSRTVPAYRPASWVARYLSVSAIATPSFNIFSMSMPIAEHEARVSARVPHEVREAAERAAEAHGVSCPR